MHSFIPRLITVATLFGSALATAAPVDLGAASSYNLVSFGNLTTNGNSIGGSVAVAGDLTAQSMGLNGASLVVGGNLDFRSGSIAGSAYVGGTRHLQSASIAGAWLQGGAPLDFTSLSQEMQGLSARLADATVTGRSASQYGGLHLTGTNSMVEVFDLGYADISGVGWSNLSGLVPGASIVFNIGGSDIRLIDGMLNGLDARYNVLLNFYEAQTLTLQNIGLTASILAPNATVGGSGHVNGTVVVGDWTGGVALGSGNGFRTTDVAGYDLPRVALPDPVTVPPSQVDAPNDVPEPGNLALMALGLGLLGIVRQRTAARR